MDPQPTQHEVTELDLAVDIAKKRAINNGATSSEALEVAVQARSAWRQRQIDEANDPDAPAKRMAELNEESKAIINEVQAAKSSLDDKLGASVPLPPILAPLPTKGGTAGTPSTPPAPFDLSQKPVLDAVDKELLRRRGHKVKGGKGKSKRADDQLSDKKMRELMGQSGIIFDDLPLNKDGHARRLLAATRDKIRFMVRPNGGAWIVYDEATGAWSTEAAPQRVGEHVVKLAYVMLDWSNQAGAKAAEAGLTADEKQELEMLQRRLQREHRSILSNVPSITKHASYIPASHISESAFDADPYRIAVQNGVLDLRTCKLTAHAPSNFVRHLLHVTYDPKAKAPTFHKVFTEALPDASVREWVQMFCGSCLTGDIDEQVSVWNLGAGGTGKSSIWGTMADLLGGWARRAPKGLLRVGFNGQFADADTVGKRMILDSEWKEHQRIKTDSFLRLTGDRFHSPDIKNRQSVQEAITHKLVIVANNPPVWDATDESTVSAMARRIFIVRYEHRVVIQNDNYLRVGRALTTEWDGIFAWMVEGCRKWQATPLRPSEPAVMAEWRDEYIASLGVIDPIDDALIKAGYAWDRPKDEVAWTEDIISDINKVMIDENRLLISEVALAAKLVEHGLTKIRKRKPGEKNPKGCWSGIGK